MSATVSYKDIFNASANGVLVTDAAGYLTHINRQAETILGFSARRHIGDYISDLMPLTGPQIVACLKSGEENLGHLIKGKTVDLVLFITLVRSAAGKVRAAVCIFQEMGQFEMSARKLESYQKLNRQLAAIFDASSDGLWVCDHQGKVVNINKASARLNGIRAEDMIGQHIADLVTKGLFDRSVTLEVIETQRQVSILQFVRRTNRYLLATGTPVFDDQGRLRIVVVNERDMTQLNVLREELEQTQMVTEKIRDELTELRLLELKDQAIIAESKEMREVLAVALKLARLDASNILLLGESGTGKGLLARFIHKNGQRSQKPFIPINCAALPDSLLEAELFGYERGAFTGAREQGKAGLFELAHEGTLFLDEIGDLPLALQAKLLKYLDDQKIMRLGGVNPRRIDCTVIAATNRDIEQRVKRRRFREDLFFRLNAFTIRIPPLRERPEDVFELIRGKCGRLIGHLTTAKRTGWIASCDRRSSNTSSNMLSRAMCGNSKTSSNGWSSWEKVRCWTAFSICACRRPCHRPGHRRVFPCGVCRTRWASLRRGLFRAWLVIAEPRGSFPPHWASASPPWCAR